MSGESHKDPFVATLSVAEQIKFYSASYAYHHRNELTPRPVNQEDGSSHCITWPDLFAMRYKQTISEYITEFNERKRSSRVTGQVVEPAT